MNDQIQLAQTLSYRVGEWLVSPAGSRLTRNGDETHIKPRTMDVLVHLIERAGDTVSNDELLAAYWLGGAISSTNAVHKAIAELRQVFGDDRQQARYIETVQKRGYRLVAEVVRIEAPSGAPLSTNGQRGDSERELPVAETAARNGVEINGLDGNGAAINGVDANGATVNGGIANGVVAPNDVMVNGTANAALVGRIQPGLSRIVGWSAAGLIVIAVTGAALYRAWSPFATMVDRVLDSCVSSCVTKTATLAIFPLKNLDADPSHQYLGEGMTVALTQGIARSKQIALTDPSNAVRDVTAGKSAAAAARDLGVDNLLQGTVQRSGDRLRVTLELIRTSDAVELYSGTFDDSVDHLFALQDKMSEVVGRALSVHLDAFRRADMIAGGTTNAEAYLAVQEAEFHFRRPTDEDAVKGMAAARRALALDPKYADAYWCLIVNMNDNAWRGWVTQRLTAERYAQMLDEMGSIEARAAEETPNSGVADAARILLADRKFNLVGKETELRQLIEAPKAMARHRLSPEGWYSQMLFEAGLFDESKAYAWLALERRHETPEWMWEDPTITLWRDGPAPVIERFKATVAESPQNFDSLSGLIALLAREGRYREAQTYLDALVAADQGGSWSTNAKAQLDVYRGEMRADSAAMNSYIADPRTDAIGAGLILFMLGEVERGIDRWESLTAPQRQFLAGHRLYMEYHFPKEVRDDARYQALLDRLGTGQQWRHYLEEKVRELEPFTGIGLASDHPDRKPPGVWHWKL